MRKFNVGEKAVLLYSAATYLPQFFIHIFGEESLHTRFRIAHDSQLLALFIPLFLLIVFCLQRWFPTIAAPSLRLAGSLFARVFKSRLNTLLALVLIGLAINFNLTEGISFRQKGELLSEAGLAVAILMFCKPYIYAWMVYHFAMVIRGGSVSWGWARFQAALFLVTLVLSITASLEVLPILWNALLIFTGPQRLRALFVADQPQRFGFVRLLLLILAIPLAAGMVAVMVWIGYINKIGVEGTSDFFKEVGVGEIAKSTMVRVASSYASVISFASYNLANTEVYEQAVRVPLENIPYRLSLIFKEPLQRPEITQISRLNYLNYDDDTSLERAGASPGLVASAFYLAPFPVGFFLLAIYVVMVIRIVNLPFSGLPKPPKIAAAVLFISFIYTLFESPVDYLNFIDPAFLHLILVLAAFIAAAAGTREEAGAGIKKAKLRAGFGETVSLDVR